MHEAAIFQTMAEVSVAFAGFAGIVVVFRRSTTEWSLDDRARFFGMVSNSLGALAFALLPLLLIEGDPVDDAVWRTCSAALALFLVFVFVANMRVVNQAIASGGHRLSRTIIAILGCGVVLSCAGSVANAVGWPFGPSFRGYLACYDWLILASGINFFRLVWTGVNEASPSTVEGTDA